MADKATWDAICTATSSQPASLGFYHFTMGAEENAHETVYAERSVPESDFYSLCISSLGGLLSCTDNKGAQNFFFGLGVRF